MLEISRMERQDADRRDPRSIEEFGEEDEKLKEEPIPWELAGKEWVRRVDELLR